MGIQIADGFKLQATKPLDDRTQYDSIADMKAVAESALYDGCFAYVKANKKTYQYDSTNTVDSLTGKWREFEGGGSGGVSNLSDLGDVDLSTPSDGNVLSYNGTTEKWENTNTPTPSIGVSDLTDADISTPSDGDVLTYNASASKWENSSVPTPSVDVSDLGDVDVTTPSDGDILSYNSTTSKWENGAAPSSTTLSGLSDVDLDSVTDGDTLKYDSTEQKWVNDAAGGGGSSSSTMGYAYNETITDPYDFINRANSLSGKEITVSSSLFDGKTINAIAIVYVPTKAYILCSEYPFYLNTSLLNKSGTLCYNSSRMTADGTSHPGYKSSTFTYETTVSSLTSITISGTSEVDISENYLPDNNFEGKIFITSNVRIAGIYQNHTEVIKTALTFYEDAEHLIPIAPQNGASYIDIENNTTYIWDGTKYIQTGAPEDNIPSHYISPYRETISDRDTTLHTIISKIRKYFADLKTVAFTGSYSDLSNKPSLATVATSGSYSDLSNKPTIYDETVYSTSEKVVGRWTDGSLLYQKTITVTTPSTTYSDTTVHTLSSSYRIKKIEGYLVSSASNGTFYIPVNCIYSTSIYICTWAIDNKLTMNVSNAFIAGKTAYVTITYTK